MHSQFKKVHIVFPTSTTPSHTKQTLTDNHYPISIMKFSIDGLTKSLAVDALKWCLSHLFQVLVDNTVYTAMMWNNQRHIVTLHLLATESINNTLWGIHSTHNTHTADEIPGNTYIISYNRYYWPLQAMHACLIRASRRVGACYWGRTQQLVIRATPILIHTYVRTYCATTVLLPYIAPFNHSWFLVLHTLASKT